MKKQILLIAMLFVAITSFATIKIVDQNGGGQYTTIQTAINAALNNDTVLVWPGTYMEAVNLNKNIVLMGSGYENTIITGNNAATVSLANGIIEWFLISSLTGDGVLVTGTTGIIRNCVIKSCSSHGISSITGDASIINCIIVNNGAVGIYTGGNDAYLWVINCIARNNNYTTNIWCHLGGITLMYSNSSYGNYSGGIYGLQGVINVDPAFISSTDYHIGEGTPCWNTGHPSIKDPDGTQSDMGYFGGPDCPIYPVVYEITTTPNGNNINIQAKARANY
jgi:hypothetical protein